MKQLTKTDFILYRECPQNVWMKWHRPEDYNKFEISDFEKSLGIMGNEVEELARGMFPGGYLVERRSEGARELTKKLIAEKTPVIFQAVFSTGEYLTATDVLKWNSEKNAYDIYEIKMSSTEEKDEDDEDGKPPKINKKKELQYEYDLAFQINVLGMCDTPINDKYLIRLNKKYIRLGDLDFTENQLFIKENKTEAVEKLMPIAKVEMEETYRYLSQAEMPTGPCCCYYKGRSAQCTSFSISNPGLPTYSDSDLSPYSVHDLYKIGNSKKYLKQLLDDGILRVDRVPEDDIPRPKKAKEGEKQSPPRMFNQVRVYKSKEPIIDIGAIRKELSSLKFPLYFLDYETYPTAIPSFNGYHPYQHIVFQYSLHVLTEEDFKKGIEPRHFEELFLEGDPAERIVESLRKNIGDEGRIISWYKHFENSRNKELANLVPLKFDFLQGIIKRTYDLMDIVDNQYYVHPGFKGSASIKKVQPVLAPKYAYKNLDIKSGTDAIEAYRQISKGELTGGALEEKKIQMLKYCKYDTEVMYEIWKYFSNMTNQNPD